MASTSGCELRRTHLLGTWVNKGLSSLVYRLTPSPGGPSRDDNGPPDRYKLAYPVPCTDPHHELPEVAPRARAPVHIPMHVTPKPRVLPPLQVRVPYNQDRSYGSAHERSEHGPG